MRVDLLVYEGVDLLDVGGPYEVFLTADRIRTRQGQPAQFDVGLVAPRPGPVTAYGGMVLMVSDRPRQSDLFVVPGTIDLDAALGDPALLDAVRHGAAQTRLLASVCTGSLLLAHVGTLDGVAATTHHEDVDALADVIGAGQAHMAPWVDAGRVVTSGGLSSGLAMALHLVDRLVSRDLAVRTAEKLAYDWVPDAGLRTGSTP